MSGPVDRTPIVNSLAGRMSLRDPQRRSVELLARLEEVLELQKDQDITSALAIVKSEFGDFVDFERDFPSFCFALATGVGKTRLMGAFITYLYRARGFRHFFVLAPNLTIYDKLIQDFTPNTPKYVFQGVSEFATSPPGLMTGDTYEQTNIDAFDLAHGIVVNIFNISKINTEVRGGASPKIRKLSEYIGTSYFQYLSNLPDLVLLMDESHRYRASAGVRAINELQPVLGLELTATPKSATMGPFKNVVYSYPLGKAIADGLVKTPAVGTRTGFDVKSYPTDDELDKLKLRDGIRFHEFTKGELELYSLQNDKPLVKPFMLVVARTTEHANDIEKWIKNDEFFEGRYREKVATIHSNQAGDIKDENLKNLLAVEDPRNATEIVIHVNKLGEGWDVTNLYTIVPLRASASEILTEQTIGRGLRLPYGQRTGVKAIDRLTIVAHDRFQAVIDAANRDDSLIRDTVVIGRDIPDAQMETRIIKPSYAVDLGLNGGSKPSQPELVLATDKEKLIGRIVLEMAATLPKMASSRDLKDPEVRAKLVQQVMAIHRPQATLEEAFEKGEVESVVEKATEAMVRKLIDVPRVQIWPKESNQARFDNFQLDLSAVNYQPTEQDLIQHDLSTNQQDRISGSKSAVEEKRPEDYVVRYLIEFPEIDYNCHADLLYSLAGQVVHHLTSYLKDEREVESVLQAYGRRIAELVRAQMLNHYHESHTEYVAEVTQGFTTLRENAFDIPVGQGVLLYTREIENKEDVPKQVYGDFARCLYPYQRFQSHPELRFSRILERDKDDRLKWFKPAPGQFHIYYKGGKQYEPDFIVETSSEKLICEPKQRSEMKTDVVIAKADAASRWCEEASKHEVLHGGKPWKYVLIPHDEINDSVTLTELVARFTYHRA